MPETAQLPCVAGCGPASFELLGRDGHALHFCNRCFRRLTGAGTWRRLPWPRPQAGRSEKFDVPRRTS